MEPTDGRYLVVHGDDFDLCLQTLPWLTRAGDFGYSLLLRTNQWLGAANRLFGRTSHWSLSRTIKKKVKKVTRFIGEYEGVLSLAAKGRRMDGVICGHIHFPACQKRGEVDYLNTGDWVEHGTALVEDFEGNFSIVYWEEGKKSAPGPSLDALSGDRLR